MISVIFCVIDPPFLFIVVVYITYENAALSSIPQVIHLSHNFKSFTTSNQFHYFSNPPREREREKEKEGKIWVTGLMAPIRQTKYKAVTSVPARGEPTRESYFVLEGIGKVT